MANLEAQTSKIKTEDILPLVNKKSHNFQKRTETNSQKTSKVTLTKLKKIFLF